MKGFNKFISLGEGCSVAMLLDSSKYRKKSLPLDWLLNDTPTTILEAFKDDFKNMVPTKE